MEIQKGDHYYNTDYKFNSRVRELLAKKMPSKDLSYVRAENIITSVVRAKYKKVLTTFSDNDKIRLMNLLKENSSTNMPLKNITSIVNFLLDTFDTNDVKDYVDYMLEQYNPGMVFNGMRISNYTINQILIQSKIYPFMQGIIINKKYINDLIPFFASEADEFKYDKDTLLVDKDYSDEIKNVFNNIIKDKNDAQFYSDKDISIIASFNEETIKYIELTFDGLELQPIPLHLFTWDDIEIINEMDNDVILEVGETVIETIEDEISINTVDNKS